VSEQQRPDPRKRPPDPAGTQPKFDPQELRPAAPHALPAPLTAGTAAVADTAVADAAGAADDALPPAAAATAEPAVSEVPAVPASRPPAGGSPQAARFQFLFGALGAVAVAAVALAIALLHAPSPKPEPAWSAWHPSDEGADPAQQIADYVAPQYRMEDGKQLLQVSGGPPVFKGQQLTLGVVHSGQTPAALEGNSVLYQLCGEGTNCAIKAGKPSTQRGLLVSREALELALYTFRYVSEVDQGVVMLPPPHPGTTAGGGSAGKSPGSTSGSGAGSHGSGTGSHGATAGSDSLASTGTATDASSGTGSSATDVVNHALLFNQQSVASALAQPLSATLSTVTPTVSQVNGWPDSSTVKALTEPRIYDFDITETQQTGPVMLLEPPGIGG
jgi:hypothetical protein